MRLSCSSSAFFFFPLPHCNLDWVLTSLRCTDGKNLPTIHHWSCSYYSRDTEKQWWGNKWTIFLVFALPLDQYLLHGFVKCKKFHEHKQLWFPDGSSIYILSGDHKTKTQNVKIERQRRKNHLKGNVSLMKQPKTQWKENCWLILKPGSTKCLLRKWEDWLDNSF